MRVGNLAIRWHYEQRRAKSRNGKAEHTQDRDVTECVIVDMNSHDILAKASVSCYYKDAPDKEVGREAALAKVLQTMIPGAPEEKPTPLFGKKVRAEVWEAYRLMTKVPRWIPGRKRKPAAQA